MTDRAQFEAMLEALINEDQEKAKEIFHQIVVGKSREIYEELLAEDFDISEEAEEMEEEGEEAQVENIDQGNPYAKAEDEEEEGADEEEEEEGSDDSEEDGEEEFGGEEGEGEEEGDDEGLEDRVMDLEDALEDLKAEFEQLIAGEEHEEEQNPGIHGGELDGLGDMGDEEEVDEFAGLMEYTIKVPSPKGGDNGANTKSTIDNMKNDMGGTTANIAQNFSTTTGGTQGGLLNPSSKEENFGNVNVPGGKAGKTAFTKQEPGHGAEKAGKKETADNKQSLLKARK